MVADAEKRSFQNALACCEMYIKTTITYPTLVSTPLTAYFLFTCGVILARQSFCADKDIANSAGNGLLNAQNWGPAEHYVSVLVSGVCLKLTNNSLERQAS